MEMSTQSYDEVLNMPVQRLYDYIKWKNKLLEDKRKMMNEQISK